jgi:hypothetical protein
MIYEDFSEINLLKQTFIVWLDFLQLPAQKVLSFDITASNFNAATTNFLTKK